MSQAAQAPSAPVRRTIAIIPGVLTGAKFSLARSLAVHAEHGDRSGLHTSG